MLKPGNIYSNWIVFFFNATIALLLSPYLVNKLGDVGYGIWIFVNSITGYMGLMAMGVFPTINKYVAEFVAKDDIHSLNTFLGTCRLLLLIAGVVSLIIGIIFSFAIDHILKGISEALYHARIVVLIVSVQIFMSFIFNIYESILVGLQKFELTRKLNLLNLLIRSLVIFILLYFGYKIVEIAIATLITYVIECLFQRRYVYKYLINLDMSTKYGNMVNVRKIIGFSGYIFIITLSWRIAFQTDMIVIGYFMSASMITYFSIASNLALNAQQILGGISNVVFPLASELHAMKEKEKIKNLFIDSTRYSIIVSIPICIGFIYLGKDFIGLWMGDKYSILSGNILLILAIGQLVSLSQGCTNVINICIGNHKKLAAILMGEAVANLVLSVILIKIMGIYGVALGTTIPILLVRVFIIPKMTTNYLELPFLKYIKETYYKILPAVICMIICIIGIKYIIYSGNWLTFIITSSVSTVIYMVTVYVTYLKTNETRYVNNKCTKILIFVGVKI